MQDLKNIPKGIRICENPQCGKELPASAHKNKKFCDDCAYGKVLTRSKSRYYGKTALVSRRILIRREDETYLAKNCFDTHKLIRKLISDFVIKHRSEK